MPTVLPILRQRCRQGLLAAVVDIEVKSFCSLLLKAVLVAALAYQVTAAAVEQARIYIQGEGKLIAAYLHVVGSIDLNPLLLLVQVKCLTCRSFLKSSTTHNMGGSVIR